MATAFLYSDGSFVFSSGDVADSSKTLVKSYTGWDTKTFAGGAAVPWYSDGSNFSITSVSFDGIVSPVSTAYWFLNCENLASFDATGLDTSNAASMRGMFNNCWSLASLDLGDLDTGKVTTMRQMFAGCSGLKYLDISGFNTGAVTSMVDMFNGCEELTAVYVSNLWSTSAVTSSSRMFTDCIALTGGAGTVYDDTIVDATYARIDTPETPGYFTYKKYYPLETRREYLIQGTTWYDIADAVRGLMKSSEPMSTAKVIETLSNIKHAEEVSF